MVSDELIDDIIGINRLYCNINKVAMCEEWAKNRNSFVKWCLENGYDRKKELKLKVKYVKYGPNNCLFVTRQYGIAVTKPQQKLLKYGNEEYNISEWSAKLGLQRPTMYSKLRRGYTLEDIMKEVGYGEQES